MFKLHSEHWFNKQLIKGLGKNILNVIVTTEYMTSLNYKLINHIMDL